MHELQHQANNEWQQPCSRISQRVAAIYTQIVLHNPSSNIVFYTFVYPLHRFLKRRSVAERKNKVNDMSKNLYLIFQCMNLSYYTVRKKNVLEIGKEHVNKSKYFLRCVYVKTV